MRAFEDAILNVLVEEKELGKPQLTLLMWSELKFRGYGIREVWDYVTARISDGTLKEVGSPRPRYTL